MSVGGVVTLGGMVAAVTVNVAAWTRDGAGRITDDHGKLGPTVGHSGGREQIGGTGRPCNGGPIAR